MITTYRINSDDLNVKLLRSIRGLFPHQEIEIQVYPADSNESTEYLLRNEPNRAELERRMELIEKGIEMKQVDIEQFGTL